MKLALTTNGRIYKTNKGEYYTPIVYGYSFFERYLRVFPSVRLIAHVEIIPSENATGMLRVDGPGLEVFEVPFTHGKIDYLNKYQIISKLTVQALCECDACILRIPDQLGFQVFNSARKAHLPIGVEITSNSWEFFEKGSYNSPFRPMLRLFWDVQQKRVCRLADATSYVTKCAIQKRYPPSNHPNTFTTSCSSVDIGKCVARQRLFGTSPLKKLKCLHISGSISGKAKGHKELIEAASILKKKGYILDLYLVGGGELDKDIADIIELNDLTVTFCGRLSQSQVVEIMRKTDLFVFPSYREGLPRVVVEAMANGMPCVATDLEGIKELLDEEVLVPVMDSEKLAEKIATFLDHPELLTAQSKRNIIESQAYSPSVLERKRVEFYEFIKGKATVRNEENN